MIKHALLISLLVAFLPRAALGAGEVGSLVALRGSAQIERAEEVLVASLRDPVELRDFIRTLQRSRAKVLFVDESTLTIGPDSRASVEQFVYSREGGASVFNLLEGAMRAVVGKTSFEVHTPTIVAAARGTVIEFLVGTDSAGRAFTVVACLEGTVEVRSADPDVPGSVLLRAGKRMTVFDGEPLPVPEHLPPRGIMSLAGDELLAGHAARPAAKRAELLDEFTASRGGDIPPFEQEPDIRDLLTTPVAVGIVFP